MKFKVNRIEKINNKSANIAITMRFPEEIYSTYKRLVKENNQSFNSLALAALKYALEHLE